MVNLEIRKQKVIATASAVALLLPVQPLLVGPVLGQMAEVGPLGNVLSRMNLVRLVLKLVAGTKPLLDERGGNGREIDPEPLPAERFCAYARRRATTKRVENDVTGVRTCLDNQIEQSERLLGRIPDPFALRHVRACTNTQPPVLRDLALSGKLRGASDIVAAQTRHSPRTTGLHPLNRGRRVRNAH